MLSKELKRILNSPITKAAKGRFMSIEELQQIKTILEAWEVVKKYTDTSDDIVNTEFYLHIDFKSDIKDFKIMKKALEVENE